MERMRNPSLLVCGLKHGKIWPKLPSTSVAPYVKTANPLALNARRPARPSTPLTFATAAGAEMSSSSHASAWPPFVRILSVHTVLTVASPSVANPNGVGAEGSQLLTSNIPDRGPNRSTSVNLTTLCHADAGGATCADAGDVAAIADEHTRMPMIPQLARVRPRFMTGPPCRCRCGPDVMAGFGSLKYVFPRMAHAGPMAATGVMRGDSDHFAGAQRRDVGGAVAQLREDLLGVLTERGRATAEASRRFREIHRRRRERRAARQTRIVRILQQSGLPDVLVLERLLGRVERARGDLRRFQLGQRLDRRARRRPLRHALGDDLAVVAAREIVLEARVGEPVGLAHQPRPALEHRPTDRVGDDPAVPRPEEIRGRRRLATVERGHPVRLDDLLLHEGRIVEGDRGAQERALDLLAAPGLLALHERRQRAEGGEGGRAAIHPGHRGA